MKKHLGIMLTVFGFVGGLAQVFSLGLSWAMVTFLGTVACTLAAAFVHRKSGPSSSYAISVLDHLHPRAVDNRFEVRRVDSEPELREVSELDAEAYDSDGISFEELRVWWRAYPRGIWGLWHQGTCVGGIGFWPLKKGPYEALLRGRKSERELKTSTFDRSERRSYWYIGGIFIKPQAKRGIGMLVNVSVSEWLSSNDLASDISIAAIATSPNGEAMLRRFGFRKSATESETIHRHSIYALCNIDIITLQRRLKDVAPNGSEGATSQVAGFAEPRRASVPASPSTLEHKRKNK